MTGAMPTLAVGTWQTRTTPHAHDKRGHGTAHGTGFRLITPQRPIEATKVILATGGQSYPACGTTGDGYRWAAALGHRIVPPHTALVPVTSHAPWVRALQGITLPDVVVEVIDAADKNVCPPTSDWPAGAAHCCSPISACRGRW